MTTEAAPTRNSPAQQGIGADAARRRNTMRISGAMRLRLPRAKDNGFVSGPERAGAFHVFAGYGWRTDSPLTPGPLPVEGRGGATSEKSGSNVSCRVRS